MNHGQAPLDSKLTRRFVPFAAVGLLALLTAALPPQPDDWTYVWAAGALTAVIAVAGLLVPWSRLPRWIYIVPPLAYFVVVALLREANDGSVSGYAPLALLPVVWIALNLGRKEVALGIAVGSSVFILPLLFANPESYTASDWRRATLWTGVALIVGFSIESIMRDKREQTRVARDHQRMIEAVAEVSRRLGAGEESRTLICAAAVDIAGATFAALWEPDGSGDLVLTGHAGSELGRTRFRVRGEPSGTAHAFARGERYLVSDAVGDPTLSQEEVRRTGVVSILFEPILRGGEPVGVLSVGWEERVSSLDGLTTQAVMLLSLEAAVAIERADLVSRLSNLAQTDELTGLPNRRVWDEAIRRAVGYAARTGRPLCVGVIDLDHFKDFNDKHGHQGGDRLLKSAAAAWRTVLRGGDTLARYGGEEFAVALPSCIAPEAEIVLERLRSLTPAGQTCSVGLAEWIFGESAEDLVARADEALYQAKRGGRDALVVVTA
jgi:diguanylate cyclase (GGDEF)-like protein